MILDTVQTIWDGFQGVVNSFLTLDNIFYIGVGFTLLMVLFFFIKSSLSYECKLSRSVNRLNEWLFKHQTINESNLIEFNNLIKDSKSPKILRKHWQQYMLYRDKLPSEYMSAYNCIDKPAKTSSFSANIKNFISIYRVTAVVTLFLSIISFASRAELILTYLSIALVTPVAILLLGIIFTLLLRSMQNYNLASLYQIFHIFNRYIDKASVSIPKYVDFEILFTKKEIKNGIPILGEYLEKRARQEQEELEEAQRNAVSHEEYDFSKSGVDGSLVLERAMKESETFLNFKQRTLSEIQQFESEISTLKKNYENTSKDYQRKLQASKENMERLRQQQEESTNRIEVNYIRKQQQDEVKKQEQLEKDQEDATNKFNAEINSLSAEIEKRRVDIEVKRQAVQEAMESEYQSFSSKLHKTISTDVEKVSDEAIQKISNEKDQYAQAITFLKGEVDNKDEIIKAKDRIIEELQARLGIQDSEDNQESFEEPAAEEYTPSEEYSETDYDLTTTNEVENAEDNDEDGHTDDRGYYWFNNGTYYDANGLYHDLEGNVYDSEGNLQATGQEVEVEQTQQDETLNLESEPIVEEYVPSESLEGTEETEENQVSPTTEAEQNTAEEQTEADTQEAQSEEPTEIQTKETSEENQEDVVSEENLDANSNDGHYDDRGYFWYNDNTYYDANGLFHDLEGNVYDSDGNLQATGQEVEKEPGKEEAQPIFEENVPSDNAEINNLSVEEDAHLTETNEAPSEEPLANENNNEGTEEPAITEEPVNEEVAEETPKRRAGRPKKEKADDKEDKPKRSVGRPKKEKTEDGEDKPKRSVGRPKKEKTEEVEDKPKRSVGRPKKEKNEGEEDKPKRSVGRPKKEKTEEDEQKPKRKAGRPKKTESSDAHDILKKIGQSLIDATQATEKGSSKRNLNKK